jgi:hypothetical protein
MKQRKKDWFDRNVEFMIAAPWWVGMFTVVFVLAQRELECRGFGVVS